MAQENSQHIKESAGSDLLVMNDQPPELNQLKAGPLKWVKIATVLDSGACRHVAPKGILSLSIDPTERSKDGHSCCRPSGDPIPNLGEQKVKAQSDSGQQINVAFSIAKVTRPLMSVSEMIKKKKESYLMTTDPT